MKNLIPYASHLAKIFTCAFMVQCLSIGWLEANERFVPNKNKGETVTPENIIEAGRASRIADMSDKTIPEIAEFPITGVVTDESGESLPGATVVVLSLIHI